MSSTSNGVHPLKKVNIGNGEDRISSLPDSLLVHILSFLATKYAVGTSSLSSRWKNLWASIPNLDFDDKLLFRLTGRIGNLFSFMNFVDRVFLFHDLSYIQRFHLTCGPEIDYSRLNAWISAAVRRHVRELDIGISGLAEKHLYLPRNLFTCKTLVALKLGSEIQLNIPASIHFPCLKTLHISLTFPNNELMQNLFCGCPVLEDLSIHGYIEEFKEMIFNISSPALRNLKIDLYTSEFEYFENKIMIDAPMLEYLTLGDDFLARYLLKSLSLLVKADVNVGDCCIEVYGTKPHANQVFVLMQTITNVKFLSLGARTLGALDFADDNNCLPKFPNLTHLELGFRNGYAWLRLQDLLNSVPNLEILVLKKDNSQHLDGEFIEEFNWIDPQGMPTCLLSHLKEIVITGFKGFQDELDLIRYFLESAVVLKKMSIDSNILSVEEEQKFLRKLLMFPRSSKTCQIEIS